ncbi:TRAP transporter substrate-binding protein DctP [Chloroflexota bacterium]
MALFSPLHYPGKLPLLTLTGTWTFLTADYWASHHAYAELATEFKPAREELAEYKSRFLFPFGAPPNFIFSKEPITKLTDLRGKKIRATEIENNALNFMGAVPVALGPVEVAEALQRGTLDGASQTMTGGGTYGYHEVAKYVFRIPLSGNVFGVAISDKAWKSIPGGDQKIMQQVAEEMPDANVRIYLQAGDIAWEKKMRDLGITFTDPSQADKEEYAKIVDEVVLGEWVKDREAMGLPGQKALDFFRSACAKYEKLSPYK